MATIIGGGAGGAGFGGAGGANNPTGAGSPGASIGNNYLGGGGGGAGTTGGAGGSTNVPGGSGGQTPGADGLGGSVNSSSKSASGGGGGAHGFNGAGLPTSNKAGGNGGAGGSGVIEEDGGGGGGGGYGAVVTGGGDLGTLITNVTGGNGGAGGNSPVWYGGNGGTGGVGLYLTSSATLTINADVLGGNGGNGGSGGSFPAHGKAGAGGFGLVGSDLTLTVGTGGSISGGQAGGNGARANAIWFESGTNTLEVQGGTINGNVIGGGTNDTFRLAGSTGGSYDISTVKNFETFQSSGTGTWTLTGTNANTQSWTASSGTLIVNATMGNTAFTVGNGATLGGRGALGDVTVQSGGTYSPGNSPDKQSVGDLDLSSGTLEIELGGLVVGTEYDQVDVTGSVTLGGTLNLTLLSPFVPSIGNSFTIINNDANDDITGTFAGIDEGGSVFSGSQSFKITYVGGVDSNDVVLTAGEQRSLVVTTTLDVVDATDGVTSLREAVTYANGKAGADTITFDATVFKGGADSLIRLTQGEITITDAVTIDGSTGAGVTITGDKNDDDITVSGTDITDVKASLMGDDRLDDNSRIFNITSKSADTTLESLTLTGGRTTADNEQGGAVRSSASLTLTDSVVSGNSTAGTSAYGGGIYGGSTVTLTNSTVSGNSTAGDFALGGGITASNVTLTNSTISGNSTAGFVSQGGGINSNTVLLTNSTVSGNLTEGVLAYGGGINGFTVTLTNSIVLGNTSAQTTFDEINGTVTANGLNIVGTGSDTNANDGIINADPTNVFAQTIANGAATAGVLADNGGPVQTVALKASTTNPAIDASINSTLTSDARGFTAFDTPNIGASGAGAIVRDLGAYEVVNAAPSQPLDNNAASNTIAENSAANSLVGITASSTDGDGQTVTYTLTDNAGGAFKIDSTTGVVSVADASKLDYEALGPTHSLSITVSASDGFEASTETFTINVTDVGEAATISGTKSGAVSEDGTLKASGTLSVQDQDAGEAKFQTPSSLAGTYGSFNFDADTGKWSYDLANGAVNVQALTAADTKTDTLVVKSSDGTATETITVTITGVDDSALISGTKIGAVAEDGTLKASGMLTVQDQDAGQNKFQTPASLAGTYGSFAFNADTGKWSYDLSNTALKVQSLKATDVVTDTLTVSSLDGSDTETITVTISGKAEAPTAVVASNLRGPIAENASTAAAIKFADLDITDVDGGNNVLSLSGADATLFQILNGDLYLKAGAKLDFETNPKLDVTVIVNDASVGGAIDAQKALSFSVTDIIESYIGTSKADVLTGTASDETFIGNGGADKMTGGGGRDTFVFKALSDTAAGSPSFITNPTIAWQSGLGLRDVITDFTPGNDKIDLSLIDASTKLSGNQAFAFNGTGTFSSNPGSLIYRVFDLAGTANDRTIVYADVNGDRLADMQIELTGLKTLQATDFVL